MTINENANIKERGEIMLKIFLASHGCLASGMKSSLDILLGNSDKVTVFDAYINQDSVQEHVDAFFQEVKEDDEVLMLSDLYGGSVNQVMFLYLDKPNTRLVAGVNLAFVLEVANRETITNSELDEIVEMSRQMLVVVKPEEVEEQSDFF
ncbi:PTS system, mannose-specific IIA component [Anaerorhabdus furcosa]|uniref:PTS system, mannose-specific IIA component n=2 Tax=Anaerorhabdus furcosa TaxID=118967 RepID=A0A1T4K0Z9_9FIRM|nr:PTS system, mannose-specific IIA component [Anaerorhabdus furcosa]